MIRKPTNLKEVEEWLKRQGAEHRFALEKRMGITGEVVDIYYIDEDEENELLVSIPMTCSSMLSNENPINGVIAYLICLEVNIDWEYIIEEPTNIIDIYEWLNRQKVLDKFKLVEKLGMFRTQKFEEIYMKDENGRFELKESVDISNYTDNPIVKIIETLKELGVEADWE